MKKLLLLIFLLPLLAKAQFPAPAGTSTAGTMSFLFKIAAGDTTLFGKDSHGNYYPFGRTSGGSGGSFLPLSFPSTQTLTSNGHNLLLNGNGTRQLLFDANSTTSDTGAPLEIISFQNTSNTAIDGELKFSRLTFVGPANAYARYAQNIKLSLDTDINGIPNVGYVVPLDLVADKNMTINAHTFTMGAKNGSDSTQVVINPTVFDALTQNATVEAELGVSASSNFLGTTELSTGNSASFATSLSGSVIQGVIGAIDASGSKSKNIDFEVGIGSLDGIPVTDNVTNIGFTAPRVYPLSGSPTQYAQYGKVDSLIAAAGGGTTTAALTAGNGLSAPGTFNGAVARTFKADTSILQTIMNFFPKADTRYYTKTAADARYEVPLTFTSGVARTSNTVKADTSTLQTVLNFFPKADTRYYTKTASDATYTPQLRTLTINGTTLDLSANRSWTVSAGTLANPTGLIGFTAVNGSSTSGIRADGAPAADSTLIRSVANSRTLAQTQTALNLKLNVSDTSAMAFVHLAKNETITGAKTTTKLFTVSLPGIGTAQTPGLLVNNPDVATSGNQKYSPVFGLYGGGFKTGGTPGSQSVGFIFQTQPVQGSTSPTGNLNIYSDVNGVQTSLITLTTPGVFTVNNSIVSGGSFTASSASTLPGMNAIGNNFYFSTLNGIVAVANPAYEFDNNSYQARVVFAGTTAAVLTAGNSFANQVFASPSITTAASGTNNIITNVAFRPGAFTATAGSTVTTSANAYFGGAMTGTATNKYDIWAKGPNRFSGMVVDSLLTLTNSNLTLGTAGNKLLITEGTNGSVGQTTLVSGTKAITISGLTTSSRAIVTLVSQGGTVTTTTAYAGVCTSNTLTITALTNAGATDTSDTSILNYFILN